MFKLLLCATEERNYTSSHAYDLSTAGEQTNGCSDWTCSSFQANKKKLLLLNCGYSWSPYWAKSSTKLSIHISVWQSCGSCGGRGELKSAQKPSSLSLGRRWIGNRTTSFAASKNVEIWVSIWWWTVCVWHRATCMLINLPEVGQSETKRNIIKLKKMSVVLGITKQIVFGQLHLMRSYCNSTTTPLIDLIKQWWSERVSTFHVILAQTADVNTKHRSVNVLP